MPKALCIVGMAVAVLLALLFGLDLGLGVMGPFGGNSMLMSIGFIICAAILGFLSWATFREQT